jgi:hypothetical protein
MFSGVFVHLGNFPSKDALDTLIHEHKHHIDHQIPPRSDVLYTNSFWKDPHELAYTGKSQGDNNLV